jgi:hypothetical protein
MPLGGEFHVSQFSRRLSDKIISAFNQACDRGELEVAEHLARALEAALTRRGGAGADEKRDDVEPVEVAFARLKALRERRPVAVA